MDSSTQCLALLSLIAFAVLACICNAYASLLRAERRCVARTLQLTLLTVSLLLSSFSSSSSRDALATFHCTFASSACQLSIGHDVITLRLRLTTCDGSRRRRFVRSRCIVVPTSLHAAVSNCSALAAAFTSQLLLNFWQNLLPLRHLRRQSLMPQRFTVLSNCILLLTQLSRVATACCVAVVPLLPCSPAATLLHCVPPPPLHTVAAKSSTASATQHLASSTQYVRGRRVKSCVSDRKCKRKAHRRRCLSLSASSRRSSFVTRKPRALNNTAVAPPRSENSTLLWLALFVYASILVAALSSSPSSASRSSSSPHLSSRGRLDHHHLHQVARSVALHHHACDKTHISTVSVNDNGDDFSLLLAFTNFALGIEQKKLDSIVIFSDGRGADLLSCCVESNPGPSSNGTASSSSSSAFSAGSTNETPPAERRQRMRNERRDNQERISEAERLRREEDALQRRADDSHLQRSRRTSNASATAPTSALTAYFVNSVARQPTARQPSSAPCDAQPLALRPVPSAAAVAALSTSTVLSVPMMRPDASKSATPPSLALAAPANDLVWIPSPTASSASLLSSAAPSSVAASSNSNTSRTTASASHVNSTRSGLLSGNHLSATLSSRSTSSAAEAQTPAHQPSTMKLTRASLAAACRQSTAAVSASKSATTGFDFASFLTAIRSVPAPELAPAVYAPSSNLSSCASSATGSTSATAVSKTSSSSPSSLVTASGSAGASSENRSGVGSTSASNVRRGVTLFNSAANNKPAAGAGAAAPTGSCNNNNNGAAAQLGIKQQQHVHFGAASTRSTTVYQRSNASSNMSGQQTNQKCNKRKQRTPTVLPPLLPHPLAPDAPHMYSANPVDAFAQWFSIQTSNVNTLTWLKVVEEVEERDMSCDADLTTGWLAPRRRTVAISLGGEARTIQCPDRLLREAHLVHVEALPGCSEQLRATAAAKKKVPLRRFPDCHGVEIGDAYTMPFHYATFPLMPNEAKQPTNSARSFKSAYASITIMSEAEVASLSAHDRNPCHITKGACSDAPTTKHHWEQTTDVTDELVLEELRNMHKPRMLERRVPDGSARQAWRLLAYATVKGYAAAESNDPRDHQLRSSIILRLLALPRLHLRKLIGSATPAARRLHLAQQLNGAICEQQVINTPAPRGEPDSNLSAAERMDRFVEGCVKSAFRLARDGFIGRAAAALVRTPAPTIAIDKKIEDLRKLHPSGSPAVGITLPRIPSHSIDRVNIFDLRGHVRSCCNGSSPGCDGWTFELLHDALEHEGFAHEYRHIVLDIMNGRVHGVDCRALSASSLVGIPKGETADAGTRPIALGGVILKTAATFSQRAAGKKLESIFRGSQYGCSVKGGAELIVHNVRRFIRTGERNNNTSAGSARCVVTIDFANAFNTPYRQAMWEAVREIDELVGIFYVSYREPSDLHVVGSTETLYSERGARQGTVDGPVVFSLVLQKVLNAANRCPGTQALAYLDDITILADDLDKAEVAVKTIVDTAGVLGMSVKVSKCELLQCDSLITVPQNTTIAHFRNAKTIKLLGATIGRNDNDEEAALIQRLANQHKLLFDRLRMGPSPQFFTLIRHCAIPKLSHCTRVHAPDVSRSLCQTFDALSEDLMSYWASVNRFNHAQRLIMGLPRAMGGMGLTRTEIVAPAAYHASRCTALFGARKLLNQSTLSAHIYRQLYEDAINRNKPLARHLDVLALDGSDAPLSCCESNVHPDIYGAVLRSYLMADANTFTLPDVCTTIACPGCKRSFTSGGLFGQHISNCCATLGGHVTRRHQVLVSELRSLLNEGGCNPETSEPRDLATYDCRCGMNNLPHDVFLQHRNVCSLASNPLHTSGPDIRYSFNGCTTVGDVTIVNLLTDTHINESAQDAFDGARARKQKKYGEACTKAGVKLVTLPATANGNLGPETIALVKHCCSIGFRNHVPVLNRISASVGHRSGTARLAAETALGRRPRSIALEQTQFAKRFAYMPEVIKHNAAATTSLTPNANLNNAARASLEEIITFSVDAGIRRALNQADQANKFVQEALRIQEVELAKAEHESERRAQSTFMKRAAKSAAAAEKQLEEADAKTVDDTFAKSVAERTAQAAIEVNKIAIEERLSLTKDSIAACVEGAFGPYSLSITANTTELEHRTAEATRVADTAEAEFHTLEAGILDMQTSVEAANLYAHAVIDGSSDNINRALSTQHAAFQRTVEAEQRAQRASCARSISVHRLESVSNETQRQLQSIASSVRESMSRQLSEFEEVIRAPAMARASMSMAPSSSQAPRHNTHGTSLAHTMAYYQHPGQVVSCAPARSQTSAHQAHPNRYAASSSQARPERSQSSAHDYTSDNNNSPSASPEARAPPQQQQQSLSARAAAFQPRGNSVVSSAGTAVSMPSAHINNDGAHLGPPAASPPPRNPAAPPSSSSMISSRTQLFSKNSQASSTSNQRDASMAAQQKPFSSSTPSSNAGSVRSSQSAKMVGKG